VLEIIANQYLKANKLIEKLDNTGRIIANKNSENIGCFDKDLGGVLGQTRRGDGIIPTFRLNTI